MTRPTDLDLSTAEGNQPASTGRLWTGRVLSALAALFLTLDAAMKLAKPAVVLEANKQLGYPESQVTGIGMLLLVCNLLYAVPRTSALGAILLTGYLGGAAASQLRASNPPFNIVFPVMISGLAWGGLWLRNSRVRALLS